MENEVDMLEDKRERKMHDEGAEKKSIPPESVASRNQLLHVRCFGTSGASDQEVGVATSPPSPGRGSDPTRVPPTEYL